MSWDSASNKDLDFIFDDSEDSKQEKPKKSRFHIYKKDELKPIFQKDEIAAIYQSRTLLKEIEEIREKLRDNVEEAKNDLKKAEMQLTELNETLDNYDECLIKTGNDITQRNRLLKNVDIVSQRKDEQLEIVEEKEKFLKESELKLSKFEVARAQDKELEWQLKQKEDMLSTYKEKATKIRFDRENFKQESRRSAMDKKLNELDREIAEQEKLIEDLKSTNTQKLAERKQDAKKIYGKLLEEKQQIILEQNEERNKFMKNILTYQRNRQQNIQKLKTQIYRSEVAKKAREAEDIQLIDAMKSVSENPKFLMPIKTALKSKENQKMKMGKEIEQRKNKILKKLVEEKKSVSVRTMKKQLRKSHSSTLDTLPQELFETKDFDDLLSEDEIIVTKRSSIESIISLPQLDPLNMKKSMKDIRAIDNEPHLWQEDIELKDPNHNKKLRKPKRVLKTDRILEYENSFLDPSVPHATLIGYQFSEKIDEKSPAELERLFNNLHRQREKIQEEKIYAGKKFTGVPFSATPNKIVFEDYDLDVEKKMKVVLTNISYGMNSIRYYGMSQNLKDYLEVNFKPIGRLSAGLSCEAEIVFFTKLNTNLEGVIEFQTNSCNFKIPVNIRCKSCKVSIKSTEIKFSQIIVEQTDTQYLIIANDGSLSTNFTITPILHTPTVSKTSIDDKTSHSQSIIIQPKTYIECLLTEGELHPRSVRKIPFKFSPESIGEFFYEYLITFSDTETEDRHISLTGKSFEFPIYLKTKMIDFKICMYDRNYQENIVIVNDSRTTVPFVIHIDHNLESHLNVTPSFAYVQGKSEFNIMVKWHPKDTLPIDVPDYYDEETKTFQYRLDILIKSHVLDCFIYSIPTTTEIEIIYPHRIMDFGYINTSTYVKKKCKLKNHSILPQEYGFVENPSFVTIKPNNGFGTLLPHETIDILIFLTIDLPGEYNFQILCKNLLNKVSTLKCKAVVALSPLQINPLKMYFTDTALGDSESKDISLSQQVTVDSANNRESIWYEFGRSGSFTITPKSGEILVNGSNVVTVTYKPIKKEQNEENSTTDFTDYVQVPCYVGKRYDNDRFIHRSEHTLYVDLYGTFIHPPLTITSEKGTSVVDFGLVPINDSTSQSLIFHNTTNKKLIIQQNFILNVMSPFSLQRTIYEIEPYENALAILEFRPKHPHTYLEKTVFTCNLSSATVHLKGVGVQPKLGMKIDGNEVADFIDFGYIKVGLSDHRTITLTNNMEIPISYKIKFASNKEDFIIENKEKYLSNPHCQHSSVKYELPENSFYKEVINNIVNKDPPIIGPYNESGCNAFVVSKIQGTINQSQETKIDIIFHPDRSSNMYSDILRVETCNASSVFEIQLFGCGSRNSIYIDGLESFKSGIEAAEMPIQMGFYENISKIRFVKFHATSDIIAHTPILEKRFLIGAVCDPNNTKHKTEVTFEDLRLLEAIGVTVEPVKFTLDKDEPKEIKVKWDTELRSNEVIRHHEFNINVKSEKSEKWKIITFFLLKINS
ncbi:hypothetical protein SNEBB_006277 [Seison nebaliae]|nr:hypothetical protein SNEBB_006277 [Seison nebaliae]